MSAAAIPPCSRVDIAFNSCLLLGLSAATARWHPGAKGDRSRRHAPLLGVISSSHYHKILASPVEDRPGLMGDPPLPRGRRRLSPFAPGPRFRWRRWFSWQLETSKPHCRPPRPAPALFLAVHTMAMVSTITATMFLN